MNDDGMLKKRFAELAKKAYSRGAYTYTGFLSLAEQAELDSVRKSLDAPFELIGGVEGCERRVAAFGSAELCGAEPNAPIVCISIRPLNKKFADELTHRDFLGALMNLGVERDTLGDIVIKPEGAYLFCLDKMERFIIDELTRIKHTSVRCERTQELPQGELFELKEELIQASSERLDAMIAKAYKLSRETSAELFREQRVFVNSALCENSSRAPHEGDIISVRGQGRFVYRGVRGTSKKGKLNIVIERY